MIKLKINENNILKFFKDDIAKHFQKFMFAFKILCYRRQPKSTFSAGVLETTPQAESERTEICLDGGTRAKL